jgi:hypothetical protein
VCVANRGKYRQISGIKIHFFMFIPIVPDPEYP